MWPENPYDLRVVCANTARSYHIHYIVSASSVTQVTVDGEDIDYQVEPCMWWLYEYRLFSMISHLKVFVNYRMWKQFHIWRIAVRMLKKIDNRSSLLKVVIIEEKNFLQCLCRVRVMCEQLSCSKNGIGVGDDGIMFFKYDSRKVFDLEEFCHIQADHVTVCMAQLKKFRNQICYMAAVVSKVYCDKHGITSSVLQGHVKIRKTFKTEDEKDKIPRATYVEMAQWRGYLHRLHRFLRVLDFMLQETLTRVVTKSIQFLHAFIVESNRKGECFLRQKEGVVFDDRQTILYERVTTYGQRSGYPTWNDVKTMHRRVLDTKYEAYQLEQERQENNKPTKNKTQFGGIIDRDDEADKLLVGG